MTIDDIYKKYQSWLESDYIDEETKCELEKIKDDIKEIEERFYKDLEFGTAGLRGIIGAGINRMNKYIIRRVSQGVADYVKSKGDDAAGRGIVIAYDSRYKSSEFADEAARVFAANGIKTYLFTELKPVPVLSFAIRYLKAAAGVAITASHNPKHYNGYKVYGEDGAQLLPDESEKALQYINKITDFSQVRLTDKEKAIEEGFIVLIDKEIDDAYTEEIKKLCINPGIIKEQGNDLKIIYTPLHGSGNKPVRRILSEIGFGNVIVVKEQENPDPDFPTVKAPNPEDKSAFDLALKIAGNENADLIIGTDPDSDRVGVMIKNGEGSYALLTGNQIGCLLLDYILSRKIERGELPENGFIVKTVVSTKLANIIAEKHNVSVEEVLTGFKFIGEKIRLLDDYGDKKFLFGFEESYGYLVGKYCRDKDGISASMMISEMAAYYKSQGLTLWDALEAIYKKYVYAAGNTVSFTMEGIEGMEKIKGIMHELRERKNFGPICGYRIKAIRDYLKSERYEIDTGKIEKLRLPPSDVLYYELEGEGEGNNNAWFCIRPSGTEPKIKLYFETFGKNRNEAEAKLAELKERVFSLISRG